MIWAELYIRLLVSTISASIIVLSFDFIPNFPGRFFSRDSLWALGKVLKLISPPFFYNAFKALLTLELSQAPEHILVKFFTLAYAWLINGGSHFILTKYWAGDSVSFRPERPKDSGIYLLE